MSIPRTNITQEKITLAICNKVAVKAEKNDLRITQIFPVTITIRLVCQDINWETQLCVVYILIPIYVVVILVVWKFVII